MRCFPTETLFFLNVWTTGYEDVLKSVAHAFDSKASIKLYYFHIPLTFIPKIHVDRYKHSIYTSISDSFMQAIVTQDSTVTRFHACERFSRCSLVEQAFAQEALAKTGRIVYVNPVTMGSQSWDAYRQNVKTQLQSGKLVNVLVCPPARVYAHCLC
jgi:DNA cross-link repair 1C protein